MIAALFAVAFAALPSSGEGTWFQLSLAAGLDAGTLHADPTPQMPNPPTGGSLGGGVTASLDIFGRRVVDDDAAPSLQPFLQRVARFRLDGGGGSASIAYPAYEYATASPGALLRTSDDSGRVGAHAEGYLARWLWGALGLGVDYERWRPQPAGFSIGGFGNVTPVSSGAAARFDSSELKLMPEAAGGVRWRDLLLSIGWRMTAFRVADDALQVRFWGGAFAGVRAVVHRFVALDARVDVLDGGAAGQAAVSVWLRRRYELSAGLEGGHGAFDDSPVVYDRAGGHVGVAAWLTPRVEGSIAYAPAWQQATPIAGIGTPIRDWSFVAHSFTLGVTIR